MNTEERYVEILSLRASGDVKRWHVFKHLGSPQTDAEHSAQALSLLFLLHPDPSMRLVKALLWHDCAERVAGDAPSPSLARFPEYKRIYEQVETHYFTHEAPTAGSAILNLKPDERAWLRAIDRLELYLWAREQEFMGNGHAKQVYERVVGWFQDDPDVPISVRDFFLYVHERPWRSFA